EDLEQQGLKAWLETQLAPDDSKDTECNQRLASATLRIEYPAGEENKQKWDAVKEDRPLTALNKPIGDLWHLADYSKGVNYSERVRPLYEVKAATWIRAVYSKWQLREVMADFWHNHFNVN